MQLLLKQTVSWLILGLMLVLLCSACSQPTEEPPATNEISQIENNTGLVLKLYSAQILPALNTTEEIFLYDGEVSHETYENLPADGHAYLIMDIGLERAPNSESFSRDRLLLIADGQEYQALDYGMLSLHNYSEFQNEDISLASHRGSIVFEIPLSIEDYTLCFTAPEGNIPAIDGQDSATDYLGAYNLIDAATTNIAIKPSLLEEQRRIEESIRQTYQQEKPTLSDPLIILNPYGYTPLAGLVLFDTVEPATATITVNGKDEHTDVLKTFAEGTAHILPVLGLYPDADNNVEISLSYIDGRTESTTISLKTAAYDDINFKAVVSTKDSSLMAEGFTLLHSANRHILDDNGDLRWYSTFPSHGFVARELENGHFIYAQMKREAPDNVFYEVDMLGRIYNVYSSPSDIHHDIIELPNDNYLLTTHDILNYGDSQYTVEDRLVEIDSGNGQIVVDIDMADVFDRNRVGELRYSKIDWLHLNSLAYDQNDESIVLSARSQNMVAKISYPDCEIKWILAQDHQFADYYQDYLLTPLGDDFEWFWGQHAPEILPDIDDNPDTIDIVLFDNGVGQSFDEATTLPEAALYSRGVHYRIDEVNMTVEQIFSYGEERGSDSYSNVQGDADYLPQNGNYLLNFARIEGSGISGEIYGQTAQVTELTTDGKLVFDMEIMATGNFSSYRANRMPIYPEAWHYDLYATEGFDYRMTGAQPTSINMYELTEIGMLTEATEEEKIIAQVEDIFIQDNLLNIRGYGLLPGVSSYNDRTMLVFSSPDYTIKYHVLPVERVDVLKEYSDTAELDYTMSGFNEQTIPLRFLPTGNYSVGILIETEYQRQYTDTGYTFSIGNMPSLKVEDTDILNLQSALEAALIAEYEAAEYTLNAPLTVLNPYGKSPLTALAMFATASPASISIEVIGKDEATTISHSFADIATEHAIPIYGLYAGTNNQVVLTAHYQDGTTDSSMLSIATAELANPYQVQINTADSDEMASGLTFINSSGTGDNTIAVDNNGDIRYYYADTMVGHVFEPTANGTFLMGSETLMRPAYYGRSIYEMDLLGKVHKEYITSGLHHEVRELADGSLIYAGENPNSHTIEDYMVQIDRDTGRIIKSWDFQEIIAMQDYIAGAAHLNNHFNGDEAAAREDWLHINGAWVDQKENALIVSARHQDMIISVDLDTDQINWILGNPTNPLVAESMKDYFLTPLGDNFEYPFAQHAVSLAANGNLLLFDNGNNRLDADGIALAPEENYSRAVEYKIDSVNMTVEQVYEYGKEEGSALYSMFMSDVDQIGDNHLLISFSGIIKDAEGKASDDMLQGFSTGSVATEIHEVKDNKVVFSASLDITSYRAERMPLYFEDQGEVSYLGIQGERLGVQEASPELDFSHNMPIYSHMAWSLLKTDGVNFTIEGTSGIRGLTALYVLLTNDNASYTYAGQIDGESLSLSGDMTKLASGQYKLTAYLVDEEGRQYEYIFPPSAQVTVR